MRRMMTRKRAPTMETPHSSSEHTLMVHSNACMQLFAT